MIHDAASQSSASVTAVCRVKELTPDSGGVGITAINKQPVAGPVQVRKLGLYADVQADRANHGGLDKAVYAYSQNDADFWTDELGYEVVAGLFGENLRITGADASAALIGERWRIGTDVLLEVTMPRTPCATFGRRLNEERWVKRFTQANRTGAYLRVLKTGKIQAGDPVSVEHTPAHGVSIASWFAEPTWEKLTALTAELGDGVVPEITSQGPALRQRSM